MVVRFSDKEIAIFLKERKKLSSDFWKQINLKSKRGHQEREIELTGDSGNQYRLILRKNNINPLDFSIILAHCPSDTTLIFRLRRYNGKSHEHTNRIEKITFYDYHIHEATERYQEFGAREDAYAEPCRRFSDFYSALECMIEDCCFDISESGRHPLLENL